MHGKSSILSLYFLGMGDKWTTSGRSRLKALQNRKTFAHRAVNRSENTMAHTSIVAPSHHQPSDIVNTAECHPRLRRRSAAFTGSYSAYADPISRRGICVSMAPSPGTYDPKHPAVVLQKVHNSRRIRDATQYHSIANNRHQPHQQNQLLFHQNNNSMQQPVIMTSNTQYGIPMDMPLHSIQQQPPLVIGQPANDSQRRNILSTPFIQQPFLCHDTRNSDSSRYGYPLSSLPQIKDPRLGDELFNHQQDLGSANLYTNQFVGPDFAAINSRSPAIGNSIQPFFPSSASSRQLSAYHRSPMDIASRNNHSVTQNQYFPTSQPHRSFEVAWGSCDGASQTGKRRSFEEAFQVQEQSSQRSIQYRNRGMSQSVDRGIDRFQKPKHNHREDDWVVGPNKHVVTRAGLNLPNLSSRMHLADNSVLAYENEPSVLAYENEPMIGPAGDLNSDFPPIPLQIEAYRSPYQHGGHEVSLPSSSTANMNQESTGWNNPIEMFDNGMGADAPFEAKTENDSSVDHGLFPFRKRPANKELQPINNIGLPEEIREYGIFDTNQKQINETEKNLFDPFFSEPTSYLNDCSFFEDDVKAGLDSKNDFVSIQQQSSQRKTTFSELKQKYGSVASSLAQPGNLEENESSNLESIGTFQTWRRPVPRDRPATVPARTSVDAARPSASLKKPAMKNENEISKSEHERESAVGTSRASAQSNILDLLDHSAKAKDQLPLRFFNEGIEVDVDNRPVSVAGSIQNIAGVIAKANDKISSSNATSKAALAVDFRSEKTARSATTAYVHESYSLDSDDDLDLEGITSLWGTTGGHGNLHVTE